MVLPQIDGYHLERCIEPEHPHSTISDPVYAGTDRTGRRIVVKVLHLGFPLRPESAARFLATLRSLRELSAPHVARVIDAGFTAQPGDPWFAMELVEGETLEARLARGETFTATDARTILEQLVAGIASVNAAGHVDTHVIAPHAMLSPRGLVAWNFGLAEWRRWAHDLVAGQYTAPGQIRWHPDLTPDEAKGLPSRSSNGAAALALLAFRLLTGRHYWHAANAAEANPMALLTEVVGPIEAPQVRASIALPEGFDAWFAECLAGRIGSAAAALRAL